MCKACELGKYVINKCLEKQQSINTAKLQKLLVMMQCKHLAKYGQPLFPENIVTWKCGVAIQEVNNDFKKYALGCKEKQEVFIAILNSEETIINQVIEEYGDKTAVAINNDPRLQYLWEKVYEEGRSNIIELSMIQAVFKDECIS